MTEDQETLLSILEPYLDKPGGLLPALHAVQEHYGFIAKENIPVIAEAFNQTRADVFGVVTFYADFRSEKPKKHVVKICQAEACQAVGSRDLVAHAEGKNPADVTFEAVYCLGNCACGPSVMVDEKVYGRVDGKRYDAILNNHRKKA